MGSFRSDNGQAFIDYLLLVLCVALLAAAGTAACGNAIQARIDLAAIELEAGGGTDKTITDGLPCSGGSACQDERRQIP